MHVAACPFHVQNKPVSVVSRRQHRAGAAPSGARFACRKARVYRSKTKPKEKTIEGSRFPPPHWVVGIKLRMSGLAASPLPARPSLSLTLVTKVNFIIPVYECFACLYVCAPRACLVPSELRRAWRVRSLGTGDGMIVSHHVGAGIRTWVSLPNLESPLQPQ